MQYILTNGTYVSKKCMVGMHLIGHPGPTLDCPPTTSPPPHPLRSNPRFASIEGPQSTYVDALPLLSEFSRVSIPEHLFKPFIPPSLRPRSACALRAHRLPHRPRAMQAQARHSLSTRSPACSTTASQASRARSMRIWRLACGFCAARGGGELREDEGLALDMGGLEGIDLARMYYTLVILFIIHPVVQVRIHGRGCH